MFILFIYILHCTSENVEYLLEGGREGAYVSICEHSWETSSEGGREGAYVSICEHSWETSSEGQREHASIYRWESLNFCM